MAHHEPFKALGPIDWTTVSSQEDAGSLPSLLATTFADSQTLVDSIPAPTPVKGSSSDPIGRARSATDSAVGPAPTTTTTTSLGKAAAATLRADWKEVKIGNGARDNPHSISVYRLSARDGRGTWFARRSLHRGIGFERWRAGLQKEFDETLKRAPPTEPGTGNIRGIGAEKMVENRELSSDGSLRVYHLSARFPGPTTPRDFVTLLLTTDDDSQDSNSRKKRQQPRQFMVVSKPCAHPGCPQRQGFIRGQYESVEVIREVPVEKPLRRVRSSIDVTRDPISGDRRGGAGSPIAKTALVRSARQTVSDTGHQSGDQGKTISFAEKPVRQSKSDISSDDEDDVEMAIEWLMVTRSDPGGSVPRFLVEKGTPPGIVNDARKFMDWLAQGDPDAAQNAAPEIPDEDGDETPSVLESNKEPVSTDSGQKPSVNDTPENPGPSGFYGMITSALGAAGSAAVSTLLNTSSSNQGLGADDSEDEDEDDASSIVSFASAEEGEPTPSAPAVTADVASSSLSIRSAVSGDDSSHNPATSAARHEKALHKLEERQRKAQEKTMAAQERALVRRREDEQRDAQAMARLAEKHARELAKQEERHRREREKLERSRRAEERKAEERRRKAAEREEKADLQLALERARAERDVALGQIEVLKAQVGELQAQNTRLVREAGALGVALGKGMS